MPALQEVFSMMDEELLDELAKAANYYYNKLRYSTSLPQHVAEKLVCNWHEMVVSSLASQVFIDACEGDDTPPQQPIKKNTTPSA